MAIWLYPENNFYCCRSEQIPRDRFGYTQRTISTVVDFSVLEKGNEGYTQRTISTVVDQ